MIAPADRYRFQQRVGAACIVLLLACCVGAYAQQTVKGQDDAGQGRAGVAEQGQAGAVSSATREAGGQHELIAQPVRYARARGWPRRAHYPHANNHTNFAVSVGGAAIDLARACWLEGGHRLTDCSALAYVIARRASRAGSSFTEMLIAYSALGHQSARARAVRTWPWGDIAGASKAHNARWRRLRAHVTRIAAGVVRDPCGGRAMHWGSATDKPRGRMIPVRCAGKTANTFYRVAYYVSVKP